MGTIAPSPRLRLQRLLWLAFGFAVAAGLNAGTRELNERIVEAADPGRTLSEDGVFATCELGLSWTDNSRNESSFTIERRTADGTFTFAGRVDGVPGWGRTVEFRDRALLPGMTYWYRVRAENEFGSSGWSLESSGITGDPVPVAIVSEPDSLVVREGSPATFSVGTTGQSLVFQWRRNGIDLPGETAALLHLPPIRGSDGGVYSVRISNAAETVESVGAVLTVSATGASGLVNLSTRAVIGTDESQLVEGFVISGAGTKELLLRGIGPKLAHWGLNDVLPNPRLTLYSGSTVIAENDDWETFADQVALEEARDRLSAFALDPASRDAALLVSAEGDQMYTAVMADAEGGSGIGLFEVYDSDWPGGSAQLSNFSARAFVGDGDQSLNAGFVVAGDVALTLLVRAVGPSLADFGVTGAIGQPVLTLFQPTEAGSTRVATNAGWEKNANAARVSAAITAVGAFPTEKGRGDAALLLVLRPGAYSVQVSGARGSTGIALLEAYVVR